MTLFQELNEAKLHRHMKYDELDISIEVPADGYRRGVNKKTGEAWAHKIPAHYGYIKGTHSPDGEHLDCYVRKSPKKGAKVYVVHQLTVDGSRFDEDKVMLGYSSQAEAVKAFKLATFRPQTMYGGVSVFDMEHFRLAAYQASNSHVILTSEENYGRFKQKGLLGHSIKSSLSVARRVSESLSEGLSDISSTLLKGDLLECLEWGGMDEGFPVDSVISRAYSHYATTPYMTELYNLSEDEFREMALNYLMETDSLMTDVEDATYEEPIDEDFGLPDSDLDVSLDIGNDHTFSETEQFEEYPVMEANNYVVVVHTQIMENIGSAERPSWATHGSKTVLVQEGFADYGSARAVAAQVSSGQIPVELSEGAYVLSIDVMPTGDYRQFHEDDNAEPEAEEVKEDTTDDVFFAQQVQEVAKLAGIVPGTYENKGTPTVQETRARLEALSKGYFEETALSEQTPVAKPTKLTLAQRAQALRTVKETMAKNSHANLHQVIKAVCKKVYGDVSLDEEIMDAAEMEYGSLEEFEKHARGKVAPPGKSRTIVKYEKE